MRENDSVYYHQKNIFIFGTSFCLLPFEKMGKREQPKKKSHLSNFDKEKIVEGEVVDENSRNR